MNHKPSREKGIKYKSTDISRHLELLISLDSTPRQYVAHQTVNFNNHKIYLDNLGSSKHIIILKTIGFIKI